MIPIKRPHSLCKLRNYLWMTKSHLDVSKKYVSQALIQPYTKNKLWEPARQPQQLRSVSISIKFVHPFWVFCCFTHFGGSSSCFNFDENHGAAPIAVTNRWVPSRFCSLLCWQSLLFSSWGRCSLNFWASQSCSLLSNCIFFFFWSASILLLITDGHELARCSKRTVIGLGPKLYPTKMLRMLEQAKERFGWQGGLRLQGDKWKLTWQGGGEKVEPGLVVNGLADFVFALFQLHCVFQTFIPLKDSDRNQHIYCN